MAGVPVRLGTGGADGTGGAGGARGAADVGDVGGAGGVGSGAAAGAGGWPAVGIGVRAAVGTGLRTATGTGVRAGRGVVMGALALLQRRPMSRPASRPTSRARFWATFRARFRATFRAATVEPEPERAAEISLQINALQAMCRQVFGFRLAMIALAAPGALLNAAPGLGTRLVGAAVVVTFMVSYALFRDWERFGPLLLRHPTLLAADTLFTSLLLVSAGPDTTLAYVSVCTPLLAGIVYGYRGAAVFASAQSLILLLAYAIDRDAQSGSGLTEKLLLPGLCVITGALGSSLRNLMLRFGTATRALTAAQARLAVTEAVSAERARLAREMHDSVAKTLYGVALAADGLAVSATTASSAAMEPARLKQQAELVSRAVRRAAAESRELLADLRRESDPDHAADLASELAARTEDFTTRTGMRATYEDRGEAPLPLVPSAVVRHLLTITEEAMENAHRHAKATRVDVRMGVEAEVLRLTVQDDGEGLPAELTYEHLRRTGHFGLLGMAERAASIGARIHIGKGRHTRGTEVRLELPLAALTTTKATP
ncbi:sensor histidine kinase [Streptomyces sp. NPDC059010]|uniref:sensor histidine kinase n=1 Tax=Streptomyces sp. NPDC059010 TaxID=3346695 RepID=UPI003680EB13